jgi:outer membrane protein assembly factor BamB
VTSSTPPAISCGTLYIGSWDSYLYALDAETGEELWRFKTGDNAEFHTWQVPTAICTLSLYYSLTEADGNFTVSASPLPAPS